MRSALGGSLSIAASLFAANALMAQEPGGQETPGAPPPEQQGEMAQPAQAQEKAEADEPGAAKQSARPPQRPPSEYMPGERPAPKEKIYDGRIKKIWAALLQVLAADGVLIEASDQAAGSIKTQLTDFVAARFGRVALPPPPRTKDYPIVQFRSLDNGHFSLEILVSKIKGGARVTIRPYIEGRAMHAKEGRGIWIERLSNGTIEDYYFAKLDESLK